MSPSHPRRNVLQEPVEDPRPVSSRYDYAMYMEFSFVRRDANGEVVVDSRASQLPEERPLVLWGEPAPPHTLENVGEDPIHVIVVESKPPSDH